jgi:hypothetical protein
MPVHRTLLAAACLAASIVLSACAADPGSAASLTAPTAPGAAVTAPLSVQVDAICAGRESNIAVYVDAVQVGVTNPGEPGVSRMVTVGEHQLSAISQRGTQWGPYSTTVTASGRVERLGCMPSNGL